MWLRKNCQIITVQMAYCRCALQTEQRFYWLATLQAISDPYRQAVSVAVSVCPQHGLCSIDNLRATLESFQRREPRRLPACIYFNRDRRPDRTSGS